MFSGNEKVSFADNLLSETQLREISGVAQNPGAGGWPTIRYFNKFTGYGGAAYTKKTSKAMCDELGDINYMQAFVEESAGVTRCRPMTKEHCSDKDNKFLEKWISKSEEAADQEMTRLARIFETSKHMTEEAVAWARRRVALLRQLNVDKKEEVKQNEKTEL